MTFNAGTKRTKAREGVFISYARSDGEGFASRLRARLEGEGVPLWQDCTGMEGGRDWWLQITEALDHVEFLVLVLTPNSLRSDAVRREWRHARQQGVCVYPVKGAPEIDYPSLPRWMREAHFYDLGTLEGAVPGWTKFLNDLQTRCQTRRVPFMVEDLPEDFVDRPGEFEQLISLLLEGERGEPVAITAALRGAGGYGKTTLARALCHDERVRDAFDDGVLWVTLGESPGDLTGRVEDLIQTISGERPGFASVDTATARLVELLAGRDMLIVIDDVWSRAHLRPFMQGGDRCARLITTRLFDALPGHARRVDVDAMRQEEAAALLDAGLPGGCEEEINALSQRLGEWPLLLTLVNGTLRKRVEEGQPLREALAYARRALNKRGLTFFDARDATAREEAVAKTLSVSFEHLGEVERARYRELAVFPEDADIPLGTLAKFWGATGGLDEFDAEELCEGLYRLSLLLRFDLTARVVRLHDVVRAYLVEEQGGNIRALHEQLLKAHRPAPAGHPAPGAGARWADMPLGESYLWDHLAYHLKEAGRGDELRTTAGDLNYLSAKTFLRNAAAAEDDLLAAEELFPGDAALLLSRRTFVQSGHILGRCDDLGDLRATLYCRLQHLKELAPSLRNLAQRLSPPYVRPRHALPDLPHPALVRTLSSHKMSVEGCAFSPNGLYIISASNDGSVRVWDSRKGAELLTLNGHTDWVNDCAVSRQGDRIVSASNDRTVRVWDFKSGREVLTLRGHKDFVTACAVSPAGDFILSASADGTLKVWDAKLGTELRTLRGGDEIKDCAVGPDGSYVVSASADGALTVWDPRGASEPRTLRGHTIDVEGCAVSPDGSFIVSASRDGTLKIWDATTLAERCTLHGHEGAVLGCAVAPDGSYVVSASDDMTLKVWDAASGAERLTLYGHEFFVNSCAVSPDGALVVSASLDRKLKVWNVKDDAKGDIEPFGRRGHADWVNACAVSPDGTFAVTASSDATLKVWDAARCVELGTLEGHAMAVMSCAVSPAGDFIVSASFDQRLKVWDVGSWRERLTLAGHAERILSCAVSHKGDLIASASVDGVLKIWDVNTGAVRLSLEGHQGDITCCAFSRDDSRVITTSEDKTLKVWDIATGAERCTFSGHEGIVNHCAVSPDGESVVSASADGTLKIWGLRDGAERRTLAGHRGGVNGCVISSDGSLIASVSYDSTFRVWDAKDGKHLTTLATDGVLHGCAWFPDGRHVMAVGKAGIYFLRLVL